MSSDKKRAAGDAEENKTSPSESTPPLAATWYKRVCKGHECLPRWSEFKHTETEHEALVARTASVPIIHRLSQNREGRWGTDSITVRDITMRKVLTEVLKNYEELDLDVKDYTFTPPFKPLCHRWEALNHLRQTAEEPELKQAALKLVEFLTPTMAPSIASMERNRKTGKIAFADIWQIFPPDTLVSTKLHGVQSTLSVMACHQAHDTCRIKMKLIDWNGKQTGFSSASLNIHNYSGYRRITSLSAFPISFLEDEASYRASMVARGKIFEKLRGYHFMVANEAKISPGADENRPVRRPIAGKVCIDAYAYYQSSDLPLPNLKPLPQDEGSQDSENNNITNGNNSTDNGDLKETPDNEGSAATGTVDSKKKLDSRFTTVEREEVTTFKGSMKRAENLQPLTDDQRLLATPWVKDFDLKSKQWCELCVDDLQPMVWNDEAFDKLVLPGDEKQLAWEFVEAKSLAQSENFDDFIVDKGRGLIILMFGPPGVGKTFTAEAVADKARVPLYAMSAAELGTEPADVEKALENALSLCRMWNAMLLLDEADVFLGARTADSIVRNELVSIFLRMLEYYQGTMFLTTNRIASIDPGFQSRVDLFMPYYDLTRTARRQVWRNFIERAGQDKFDVTDESLEKLAALPLNGREIKNLVKSAQLLSLKRSTKVSMDRVFMLAERRVQALAQVRYFE